MEHMWTCGLMHTMGRSVHVLDMYYARYLHVSTIPCTCAFSINSMDMELLTDRCTNILSIDYRHRLSMLLYSCKRVPMGGAPYKSPKEGGGCVSTFNRERAPMYAYSESQ